MTCPHCRECYDEDNDTQPCCPHCGHPIACECNVISDLLEFDEPLPISASTRQWPEVLVSAMGQVAIAGKGIERFLHRCDTSEQAIEYSDCVAVECGLTRRTSDGYCKIIYVDESGCLELTVEVFLDNCGYGPESCWSFKSQARRLDIPVEEESEKHWRKDPSYFRSDIRLMIRRLREYIPCTNMSDCTRITDSIFAAYGISRPDESTETPLYSIRNLPLIISLQAQAGDWYGLSKCLSFKATVRRTDLPRKLATAVTESTNVAAHLAKLAIASVEQLARFEPDGFRCGEVVSWLPDKGFGFINAGLKDDLYFRGSSVSESDRAELKRGRKVKFQIGGNKRGLNAEKVALLDQYSFELKKPDRFRFCGQDN